MTLSKVSLTIANLQQQYATAQHTPTELVEHIIDQLAARGDDGVWTYTVPEHR